MLPVVTRTFLNNDVIRKPRLCLMTSNNIGAPATATPIDLAAAAATLSSTGEGAEGGWVEFAEFDCEARSGRLFSPAARC